MQRTVSVGHAQAKSENMDYNTTSWRLQTSASSPDYNVGELEEFRLELHVEPLFASLRPSYAASLDTSENF